MLKEEETPDDEIRTLKAILLLSGKEYGEDFNIAKVNIDYGLPEDSKISDLIMKIIGG